MAIKRGIMPQLAEVGKIKIGGKGAEKKSKAGNKYRVPVKWDYFVVTSTERDSNGDFIRDNNLMTELLKGADKVTEIPIRLPFDNVDKNFFTQFQFYASRKKACSGDGEKAIRVMSKSGKAKLPFEDAEKTVDVKEGQRIEIKCDPEKCIFFNAEKGPTCKVSGILSVFLPQSQNLGGVHKFRTHSYNSVTSILGALEYFKANTGGVLQGLPLRLVMIKKTTEEHGTINYVTIVIDGLELRNLRTLAIEERENRKLLGTDIKAIEDKAEQSGFFKDTDSPGDVQDEYYGEYEEVEPEQDQSEEIKADIETKKEAPKPEVKEETAKSKDLF